MFIGTIIISIMYLGLTYSIAEMSPALPHTGGAYSFARTAFGPWGGFITGIAENIEYVLTPAVIVFLSRWDDRASIGIDLSHGRRFGYPARPRGAGGIGRVEIS